MASGGWLSRKAEFRAALRSVPLRTQPEQEPQDDLVEDLWPLHLREMSRVRDNRQLSARAASRLESLGFTHVYRYTPGKDGWLAMGLPTDGPEAATPRAGDIPSLVELVHSFPSGTELR